MLAVVSLASVLVILAIQMPSVVLPAIGQGLGASFAELQWVVNAYALTLAALLLAAGSLSDRPRAQARLCLGARGVPRKLATQRPGVEPVWPWTSPGPAQGVGGAALLRRLARHPGHRVPGASAGPGVWVFGGRRSPRG